MNKDPYSFEDLRGSRVLVTGASSGIGAGVASALVDLGANVALHYRSGEENVRAIAGRAKEGQRTSLHAADLSDPANATPLVTAAAKELGGLDIVVNNAGGPVERTSLETLQLDALRRIVDLNLTAAAAICQAAVQVFLEQGNGGVIVNSSSQAARAGGGPGAEIYAASKGGISALTRAIAKGYAGRGIRANAVAPGFIETPLHSRLTDDKVRAAMIATIPLGRPGQVEDCVGAYLFLASSRLSGFITGHTIEVNGGASFA